MTQLNKFGEFSLSSTTRHRFFFFQSKTLIWLHSWFWIFLQKRCMFRTFRCWRLTLSPWLYRLNEFSRIFDEFRIHVIFFYFWSNFINKILCFSLWTQMDSITSSLLLRSLLFTRFLFLKKYSSTTSRIKYIFALLGNLFYMLPGVNPCKSFIVDELRIVILGSLILLLFIFVSVKWREPANTPLSVKWKHICCELRGTNLWKNVCIIESSHVIISSHCSISCNWTFVRLLLFNRFAEFIKHACCRLSTRRTLVKLSS